MLNLFVPIGDPVVGARHGRLGFTRTGEIQKDFAARVARRGGAFLIGTANGCMCGFDDWPALYQAARDLLAENGILEIEALRFWSKDRYTLTERVADLDDAEACTPLVMGEIVVMRVDRPERRRHRLVVRALSRSIGAEVTLRMKSGRELRGVVTAFDPDSETGSVGPTPFVAAQVLAVDGP